MNTCTCFTSDNTGYWAGSSCDKCLSGYSGSNCEINVSNNGLESNGVKGNSNTADSHLLLILLLLLIIPIVLIIVIFIIVLVVYMRRRKKKPQQEQKEVELNTEMVKVYSI